MEPLFAVQIEGVRVGETDIVGVAWSTYTSLLAVQPFLSVMLTEYCPEVRLLMFCEVDVKPPGPVHKNVYGAVPPLTVKFIDPVLDVHNALVTTADEVIADWV